MCVDMLKSILLVPIAKLDTMFLESWHGQLDTSNSLLTFWHCKKCTRAAFSEESDAFCLWEDRENGKACSFVSVTNKCVFKCSGRTTEKGKALEDKTQRDNSDTLFIHLEQI